MAIGIGKSIIAGPASGTVKSIPASYSPYSSGIGKSMSGAPKAPSSGYNMGSGKTVPSLYRSGMMGPQAPQMPDQPSAQINVPPAQQYNPYQTGQAQGLNQNLERLSEAGSGLLDPNSDYYKQLSQQMQRQIGEQSAAQQRAAALRGAYSGLGGGASPETMATAGDIAQGGLEAQGRAEAGLALRAPQMGAGMLAQTFSPMLGLQQLQERSRQFGAGLGEQARQFGVNTAMQQQQLAGEQAWRQAQLQAQQQRAQQEAMMRQMSMMFGMF